MLIGCYHELQRFRSVVHPPGGDDARLQTFHHDLVLLLRTPLNSRFPRHRASSQRPSAYLRLVSSSGRVDYTMDLWAHQNQLKIDFSRPGKPTDYAYVESFS
jgi:hypothetical protein